MKISRREFIKMGIGAGLAMTCGSFAETLFAQEVKSSAPDMVAVRNGGPVQMFEAGIKEYGGMSRFVKSGQTVVVKPNIGWAKTPEFGATTDPGLVARIIEHCYKAGAKKVYVFDNTCNAWNECYEKSGISKAAKDASADVKPANKEESYKKVAVKGEVLKEALVNELFLEADVVINVPILKHHGSAQMTGALKNYMGVVWDRRFFHSRGLHECIADSALIRKADLTIIDAYQVMKQNGPRGISKADLMLKQMQIIATDMVAADTAAAKILEYDVAKLPFLAKAEALKVGSMAIDKMTINRITL